MINLYCLLLFCHFLGDFTHLSTPAMLSAKRQAYPLLPIYYHACVHGLLMGVVLLFYFNTEVVLLLIWMQVNAHFAIDLWKGIIQTTVDSTRDARQPLHWYLFGFDQFLHQLVIALMIVVGQELNVAF